MRSACSSRRVREERGEIHLGARLLLIIVMGSPPGAWSRMYSGERMEKATSAPEQGSSGIVPGAGVSRVLLLFAATPTEDSALRGWIERSGYSGAKVVHAGRSELEASLAGDGAWDPEIVPVRVAWLAPERGGVRRARVRDVLTLSDPRSPSAAAHARIAGREPDRCRVSRSARPRGRAISRRRFATGGGERSKASSSGRGCSQWSALNARSSAVATRFRGWCARTSRERPIPGHGRRAGRRAGPRRRGGVGGGVRGARRDGGRSESPRD